MLIPTLLPPPPVATPGVLNLLFEPSTALHALVVSSTPPPFDTYAELVRWTTELISALPRDDPRLIEILGSHPRLGEKQVESEVSRAEQKSLGEGEERLRRLNSEYEEKFPGESRYSQFGGGGRLSAEHRVEICASPPERRITSTRRKWS